MSALIKTFAPLLAVVVLLMLVAHFNYADGYSEGFKMAKAEGDAALSALEAKRAGELATQSRAAAEAAQAAAEQLRAEVSRGNALAKQLGDQKAELGRTTDKLNGEIANVTTRYRRALDAQLEPLPPSVFTNGFVRVWNSALGIAGAPAVQANAATSGADASAGRAGAADSLDSGVTQAGLLRNHNFNGERFAACRAQLNRLIDWNSNGHN